MKLAHWLLTLLEFAQLHRADRARESPYLAARWQYRRGARQICR